MRQYYNKFDSNEITIHTTMRDTGPRGGYSLCDGWYICAAVLTPFFHFGRIEHDLFGVFFLIHQHQNDLLWYYNYQFLQNSIF